MTKTRNLAAVLAADVVGFSRLAGADEDHRELGRGGQEHRRARRSGAGARGRLRCYRRRRIGRRRVARDLPCRRRSFGGAGLVADAFPDSRRREIRRCRGRTSRARRIADERDDPGRRTEAGAGKR